MINYNTPASSILKTSSFSISQDAFLMGGSYSISGIGSAAFIALYYRILGFNNTWNLANPQIQLNTDTTAGNNVPLQFNNGTLYTDPIFMIYPTNSINGSTLNGNLSLSWVGAAFTPGGSLVNFTLYYVNI